MELEPITELTEFDGYVPGEIFEADVANLVAEVNTYMTTGVNKESLADALECVQIWLEEQEDDPRLMGWVGRNGLP